MPSDPRDPDRLGATRLPDGRRLAWAEWGPEAGAPVLLCPGAATSRRLGFAGDLVDALAVRLISLDRPGLGGSDPSPGRTLLDWSDDVRRFLDARALPRPAIVGFSQGAPFALACAAAGLVRGAAVVSGTDELAAPIFASWLPPELRRLVDAVADDPAGAEAMFRGFGDPDAMWARIVEMSGERDREVYCAPGFARIFRQALAEGFAQGPAGYARDTALTMGRWPFDPAAITVPVDLWYGECDASPVHSPDLGAALAGRLPTARRRVLAGVGGALLWTHAREVLASLLARCDPA